MRGGPPTGTALSELVYLPVPVALKISVYLLTPVLFKTKGRTYGETVLRAG